MESVLKTNLQKSLIGIFGFEKYLQIISDFRIRTFHQSKRQEDFRKFVRMIPAGAHVLDIGANIGVTTYYLSKYTKDCVIHSFEPIPSNFRVLKNNVLKNGLQNVSVYNIGLGATTSQLNMILPIINGVKRHALCQIYDENSIYTIGEKFKISIESLDNFTKIRKVEGRIKAIKIDVENFEIQVLSGARKTIEANRPIVFCEFWDNENKFKVANYFKSLNYQVMVTENDSLINFFSTTTTKGNFFMLPQPR